MHKDEAKNKRLVAMTSATSLVEAPPRTTSSSPAPGSPQFSGPAPTQPSASNEDNPWRRFLALGKGLATDADSVVNKVSLLDKSRLAGAIAPRGWISPSGTGAASPPRRTPEYPTSPYQLGGTLPTSPIGFSAPSTSLSPLEYSHKSGRSSGLTAQRAPGTSRPVSPSSPDEYPAASGQPVRTTRSSDVKKAKPQAAELWFGDAAWSLAVTAASLALMGMILVVVLWVLYGGGPIPRAQLLSITACVTDDCSQHAARLADAMNSSAEPCDDFEQFACGHREPPPRFRSFDTTLKRHWHILDANLMLTRSRHHPPRFAASRKATAMLSSCLHQGSLEERRLGRSALIGFMRERGLSWPEPSGPGATSKCLQVLLDLSLKWAVDIWFRLNILRHKTGTKLYFREPVVFVRAIEELRRLDEPHRRGERIRVLLHQLRNATEASRAIANPDAEDAFIKSLRLNERAVLKTFQRSMRGSSDDGNRLDKLPLKFMESITPALPGATWLRILRRVLNGTAVVVSEDDLVLVVNSRLLSALGELIVTLSDRLVDQVALWFLQLHAHLLPIQPLYMIDRVLFCHSAVEQRFGSVVAAEHVANQFNEMRRRQIEAVLRDVLLRMTELVKSGDWVPRDTADKMVAKLDNITVRLWPNNRISDAWLTRMYSGFPDRAPSYVHFWLAAGKAQSLWLLGTARNTTPGISIYDEDARWRAEELHFRSAARDPPIEYDYWGNAVLVSPAALYAPLFYAQAMDAIVYAGLGATVARVAARAFDERGIDVSAGENQSDWLSDSARRQFVRRAKCMQPAVKAAITGLEGLKLRALEGGLHVLGERSPWQVFFLSFCQPLCGLRAESGGPRCVREGHSRPGAGAVIASLKA